MVRGISPFAAGIAEMNLGLFYLWTFLGSLIFCSVLIVLGNALGAHLGTVLPLLHHGGVRRAAASAVVAVVAAFS